MGGPHRAEKRPEKRRKQPQARQVKQESGVLGAGMAGDQRFGRRKVQLLPVAGKILGLLGVRPARLACKIRAVHIGHGRRCGEFFGEASHQAEGHGRVRSEAKDKNLGTPADDPESFRPGGRRLLLAQFVEQGGAAGGLRAGKIAMHRVLGLCFALRYNMAERGAQRALN